MTTIDTYIDRHRIAGLATELIYAIDRERGEIILPTHRSVVLKHFDIRVSESSIVDIGGVDDA